MARYCNLDELIKKFEDRNRDTCNGSLTYLQLLRMIKATSTADVVPKSDVARLQSEINRLKKYDEERDIALHARLISETRVKVAREIIGYFESRITQRNDGTYCLPVITPDCIAELKKKYITETQL